LLAKAVASECGTTFFNISSATIVSKWRGDSEKIVKVLFQLARYHAPSTIFFDEFDALGSKRDTGESDAARRLKSEILQQMDGVLAETFSSDQKTEHRPVFILAATNLPWDLDPAILRRLEKRIYVPLPNLEERRAIFHLHFSQTAERVAERSRQGRNALMYQIDLDALASATEGYSGSDLQQIVKETVIRKFRQNFANKIKKLVVVTEDVLNAIQSIPATVKSHLSEKYTAWDS
jgi:katanin p60 ATPase-containing subunit A1